MTRSEALVKVGRHAIIVRGQRIPATFFKHGQPGNHFVCYPEDLGRLSHVKVRDLDAIRTAYGRHQEAQGTTGRRPRKKSAATHASKAGPKKRASKPGAVPTPAPKAPVPAPHLPQAGVALREANRLAQELASLKARLADGHRIDHRLVERLERERQAHLDAHMRASAPPGRPTPSQPRSPANAPLIAR